MRSALLWIGVLFLFCVSTNATTYYISPNGNNGGAGTTAGAPWGTFAYAIPKLQPGDNLVLLDGLYNETNSGFLVMASVHGTSGQPITIKAQNERKAHIHNHGGLSSINISASSYVTFDGLQLSSEDNASLASDGQGMQITNCDHLVLRRLLVHHNNRYGNNHLITCIDVSNSLFEECEFYYHHRHAIMTKPGGNNTFRRIYCNSRGYGNIPGGYPNGHGDNGGDVCISCYPAKSTIIENVIAEGHSGAVFDLMASGEIAADSNQFLGNIALETEYGVNLKTRDDNGASGALYMPKYNTIKNLVLLNTESTAGSFRGVKGQRFANSTILNSGGIGVSVDVETGTRGDGIFSFFAENILTANNGNAGFYLTPDIQTWSADHFNSFGNAADNYYPASSPSYVVPTSINPSLGTCKVWIPESSPMKHAGKNGEDIGANILYRYQDGILTNEPLWDPQTGEFPHGAIIAGINDVVGQSLFDVNKRLNVNCNSCPFPVGYPTTKIVVSKTFDVGRKIMTLRATGAGISIQWNGLAKAKATVYSPNGKKLGSIEDVGTHSVWNPGKSAAGVYLVKVESENVAQTAKVFCGR